MTISLRMVPADRPDSEPEDWLFHNDRGPRIALRAEYAIFACPRCKKFPEITILEKLGAPTDFLVRSTWDFVTTADGVLCISTRLAGIIQSEDIRGIRFIPLPGDSRYVIALPALPMGWVAVDIALCGMEFRGLCPVCMRYGKTLYWPQRRAMRLPEEDLIICSPLVFSEGRCRIFPLMTTRKVADILRRENVTGLEFLSHGF